MKRTTTLPPPVPPPRSSHQYHHADSASPSSYQPKKFYQVLGYFVAMFEEKPKTFELFVSEWNRQAATEHEIIVVGSRNSPSIIVNRFNGAWSQKYAMLIAFPSRCVVGDFSRGGKTTALHRCRHEFSSLSNRFFELINSIEKSNWSIFHEKDFLDNFFPKNTSSGDDEDKNGPL